MKAKISNNGDYAVFAELINIETNKDVYCLKFTSTLNSANSSEEQHKFSVFLSKEEVEKLKNIL